MSPSPGEWSRQFTGGYLRPTCAGCRHRAPSPMVPGTWLVRYADLSRQERGSRRPGDANLSDLRPSARAADTATSVPIRQGELGPASKGARPRLGVWGRSCLPWPGPGSRGSGPAGRGCARSAPGCMSGGRAPSEWLPDRNSAKVPALSTIYMGAAGIKPVPRGSLHIDRSARPAGRICPVSRGRSDGDCRRAVLPLRLQVRARDVRELSGHPAV
jgi:hypothetical protein